MRANAIQSMNTSILDTTHLLLHPLFLASASPFSSFVSTPRIHYPNSVLFGGPAHRVTQHRRCICAPTPSSKHCNQIVLRLFSSARAYWKALAKGTCKSNGYLPGLLCLSPHPSTSCLCYQPIYSSHNCFQPMHAASSDHPIA
jgi:hypothetical protein